MFQSIVPAVRSAFFAAALLGLVAAGVAIRGAASVDVPSLGAADDHGTRHAMLVESGLSQADDYGTRNQARIAELSQADDYGTRNQPQVADLSQADDFGTRHAAQPSELGAADDYATRHGR